jgi:uncharacterized membrane protein YGL010W
MFVVRYVALAALVVWLGALQSVLIGEPTPYFTAIAYGCGAALVLALLTMKFIGPPPRMFFTRLGLVIVMLLVTFVDHWLIAGRAPAFINTALGLVLLAWYAHE